MKKFYLVCVFTALCMEGCQQNDFELVKSESCPFIAVTENYGEDASSRTSLDSQGNVRWKKGDKLYIFYPLENRDSGGAVSDDSDGKTTAYIYKDSHDSSRPIVYKDSIKSYVAYYPYPGLNGFAKSRSNYELRAILPATQIYEENSFGNGSFPMVAVTNSVTDYNLKFKNVLGALMLQLKGTAKIKSIIVVGNNNENLCDTAKITASCTFNPVIEMIGTRGKSVTLDCGKGVQLNSTHATSFVIALPPMTMTKGFTVIAVDTEGKYMEIKTNKPQTITRSGILYMPEVNYVGIDNQSSPFTITSTGSTSVGILKVKYPVYITLEYRKGNDPWADYTIGKYIDLSDGESIQFRAKPSLGNRALASSDEDFYLIRTGGTGTVKVSGNIMSLLDVAMQKRTLPDYAFYKLFVGCENLTDASQLVLPVVYLAESCYAGMFQECINLINVPNLPATVLAKSCYADMFAYCLSLKNAPKLPATVLAKSCYSNMFSKCRRLVNAPELPATTLAENCYKRMFNECLSLVNAPKLPATTMAKKSYYDMFLKCSNLTSAPELSATELADSCYYSMFSNCASLINASKLPATSLTTHCYSDMFYGCTSLANAPELPATELAVGCYERMFYGCTSLVNAPELPATKLTSSCYWAMFYGCTKLNYVKALFTTTPSYFSYNWLSGVSPTGTFVKSADATWTNEEVGIPSGWTVEVAK